MAERLAPPAKPRPAAITADGVGRGWILAGAIVLVLALVAALLYSGAAAARQLSDPGALTRWALPLAKAVNNTALAAVIASLLFAVGILPKQLRPNRRPGRGDEGPEHPAFTAALRLAAIAAVVWTLAAMTVLVFSFSDIAGLPVSGDASYTAGFVGFMTDIGTGQAWLSITIVAAIVATLILGIRSLPGLGMTLALATIGGLLPMALIGHSAGGDDHYGAVNSIGLHLLGACLWVGGIIVLAFISGTLGTKDITGQVLRRYSSLALISFFLVFFSGVINASIRITSLDQLSSPYGVLVVIKALATLLLGAIGLMHRQWIIPELGTLSGKRVLWQLITVELLIMAAVFGIATALGRTAPPTPEELPVDASPARILTGYDLPPELVGNSWLTVWRWDWLWVTFALVAGIAYLVAAVRLHRRGDRWPVARTVSWIVGLLALTYVTSGAPAVYGMVLFSAHMLDHMALTMVVPLFLVLGSPITLALKALPPRGDGSKGLREWILWLVHSKYSQVITHPLFAAANFAGSIIIFYYSPMFRFALDEHTGHELMNLHFLLTGYIFILTMIGQDPLPRRAPYPMRLLILFATMAFHAFFGVALTSSTTLIQASWFGSMGREWGLSAMDDQQVGGAIMWGVGEIPTLCVAVGVAIMWSRSDARETKRKDRSAERNNDAELAAYNDMFARMARQDERMVPPGAARPAAGHRTPGSQQDVPKTTNGQEPAPDPDNAGRTQGESR
ncbi:cytochrome c oxidase assembly protein [Arthrobacter sulfonylureivorans]|uniref:cytochrome c oxidase assembly protein n=1 Tax=Arthrobacter sulfonylureivorans TaxID=2486855 RepID=UPI0039E26F5E